MPHLPLGRLRLVFDLSKQLRFDPEVPAVEIKQVEGDEHDRRRGALEPLLERKAALKKIITGSDLQLSDSFEIDGREMFTHACKVGLEGVVSKVRDSIYASGRGNNWIKKTCAQRETLTIAGFALDEGKWDGIYLARRKGDHLIYAGKVDHVVLQDGEIGAAIGGRHHDLAVYDGRARLESPEPTLLQDLPQCIRFATRRSRKRGFRIRRAKDCNNCDSLLRRNFLQPAHDTAAFQSRATRLSNVCLTATLRHRGLNCYAVTFSRRAFHRRNRNNALAQRLTAHQQPLERVDMKTRLAISLAAVSLLAASTAAFAQSTTEQGARDGARAGGDIGGPVGAMVGGTVGAAVGAGLEIPNAVLGGIPRDDSVVIHERVVVGEPLPPTVVLRPVPNYTEYRYAVVNDRRVIVEPRTRRVVKIID
ncbi:hypothetical protein ACVIJW_011359 [Bradyrhizobium barranii subsp. barranii]